MAEKNQKSKLIDDYEWLTLGFCAALRSKDYFLFLRDVFTTMNKIQLELEPGPRSDTYFLDKIFKTKSVGKNWLKICAVYERGMAPLREFPVSRKSPRATTAEDGTAAALGPEAGSSLGNGSGTGGEKEQREQEDDLVDETTTREVLEYRKLMTSLRILYPPPGVIDDDMKSFAKYFLSRPADGVDRDFNSCKDALELTCMSLASYLTPEDERIRQEKGLKKSMDRREERMRLVRNLFSLASSQFVCSSSELLKNLLAQSGRSARHMFHAGEGAATFDGKLGGFHGTGLIAFLGGTSGFKTGVMSSLVANHCLASLLNDQEAPAIWGYIGEDGVEAYTRRVLTNIMNRDPLMTEFGFGSFSLSDFSAMMGSDPKFREVAFGLADSLMANCHWIKAPENPEEKLKFSVVQILNAFDAKMQAGDIKPKFIIMDYLNLLTLPRDSAPANRAQELSSIAHMLDEWAQQKGLTIITAVQASITGAVAARDMRFYMQEDLHESKSIAHHCRMVISLLPYTEFLDGGQTRRWMAVQFLKNRDGEKDMIFTSQLNERSNITFADSKFWTEAEWARHKENMLRKKAELFGIEMAPGGDGRRGGGQGGGGGFGRGPQQGGGQGGGQRRSFSPGGGGGGFAQQGQRQGGQPQVATSDKSKLPPDAGDI